MPASVYLPDHSDDDDDDGFEGGKEHRPDEAQAKRSPTKLRSTHLTVATKRTEARKVTLRLGAKKVAKEMDAATKAMVMDTIKGNRFCKLLEEEDIEPIVDSMEFFSFAAGDEVVKQGAAGVYFFIVDEGEFEVTTTLPKGMADFSGGSVVGNKLSRGVCFGAPALLYDCPRSATVTAMGSGGVWGAHGDIFRDVLHEHAKKHHDENRKCLDAITLFNGLTSAQKERVGELALHSEVLEAGAKVVGHGQIPNCIYVVKAGEVVLWSGGAFERELSSGTFSGGTKVRSFKVGDSFGAHAAVYRDPYTNTAIAETRVTLVCVGIRQLKEVLDQDLLACLEWSLKVSIVEHIPVIAKLSPALLRDIVEEMPIEWYEEGAAIPEGFHLLMTLEGMVCGVNGAGAPVTLRRGQWCQDEVFLHLEKESCGALASLDKSGYTNLRVTGSRAKLCVLSSEMLNDAFQRHHKESEAMVHRSSIGRRGSPDAAETAETYLRKVLCVQKVAVFREVSDEQRDGIVCALNLSRHGKGAHLFQQGDVGSSFFIVCAGEVSVLVNGKVVQTLGPGSCFGERALLLQEKRDATVEVSSENADVWSIGHDAFKSMVCEDMFAQLVEHVKLKDNNLTMKSLKHVRVIGAGAFGSVRLVEHRKTKMRYALKRVMKSDGVTPPDVVRECEILAEVDHPFIICLVKTFESSKSVYILTELITGGELYAQTQRRMGVLSRKQAQFYIGSLVIILEALHHRSIAYRDLKPENVMLDDHGYLKLVDFGLARKLDTPEGRTYTIVGTLYYMAPEVLKGHGYGCEVDIWSLGVMLFELVCGELPFGQDADSEEDIMSSILADEFEFPSWYNDLAGKKLMTAMLCKHPEQRIGTGIKGWDEIRTAKFFKQGGSNLFPKIGAREMDPPVIPEKEQYSEEGQVAHVTLSDSEELGADAPSDVSDKVLESFKRFDLNRDGKIDRNELGFVLKALDAETFTEEAVDDLLSAVDVNGDGNIEFSEFFDWVFSEEAEAFRDATQLDFHG